MWEYGPVLLGLHHRFSSHHADQLLELGALTRFLFVVLSLANFNFVLHHFWTYR